MLTAAVYLPLCMLKGFTDMTLIDYGLPKFCEVRSAKCEVVWISEVLSSSVTGQKCLQLISAPPSSSTDAGQTSVWAVAARRSQVQSSVWAETTRYRINELRCSVTVSQDYEYLPRYCLLVKLERVVGLRILLKGRMSIRKERGGSIQCHIMLSYHTTARMRAPVDFGKFARLPLRCGNGFCSWRFGKRSYPYQGTLWM